MLDVCPRRPVVASVCLELLRWPPVSIRTRWLDGAMSTGIAKDRQLGSRARQTPKAAILPPGRGVVDGFEAIRNGWWTPRICVALDAVGGAVMDGQTSLDPVRAHCKWEISARASRPSR